MDMDEQSRARKQAVLLPTLPDGRGSERVLAKPFLRVHAVHGDGLRNPHVISIRPVEQIDQTQNILSVGHTASIDIRLPFVACDRRHQVDAVDQVVDVAGRHQPIAVGIAGQRGESLRDANAGITGVGQRRELTERDRSFQRKRERTVPVTDDTFNRVGRSRIARLTQRPTAADRRRAGIHWGFDEKCLKALKRRRIADRPGLTRVHQAVWILYRIDQRIEKGHRPVGTARTEIRAHDGRPAAVAPEPATLAEFIPAGISAAEGVACTDFGATIEVIAPRSAVGRSLATLPGRPIAWRTATSPLRNVNAERKIVRCGIARVVAVERDWVAGLRYRACVSRSIAIAIGDTLLLRQRANAAAVIIEVAMRA